MVSVIGRSCGGDGGSKGSHGRRKTKGEDRVTVTLGTSSSSCINRLFDLDKDSP